jgi:hypothetical protein
MANHLMDEGAWRQAFLKRKYQIIPTYSVWFLVGKGSKDAISHKAIEFYCVEYALLIFHKHLLLNLGTHTSLKFQEQTSYPKN